MLPTRFAVPKGMNIVVKRSGEYPDGRQGWFTGSVNLTDDDLLQLVYEKKVPGYRVSDGIPYPVDDHDEPMPLSVRFKTMRRTAELMMIQWFAEEGLISPEEAKRQAAALRG